MEKQVVSLLMQKNWRIAFAESCTGGMAVARLVGVSGASNVLDVSMVTYANAAKVEYLGVSVSTISRCGVVSEEVAGEMAHGVATRNNANVGVGVSGIASEGGDLTSKPVGMVCFGFYINGTVRTFTKQFGNIGRNNVRAAAVDFIYSTLLDLLQ